MKKKISIVLIIIGISIILYPVVGKFYTDYQDNQIMKEWDEQTNSDFSESDATQGFKDLQSVFNSDVSTGTDISTTDSSIQGTPDTKQATTPAIAPPVKAPVKKAHKILGILKIDKIDLELPILEGATSENLSLGAGHLIGTSGIGQIGNCAIAGHRNYTFAHFFKRLDELEVGDTVIITIKLNGKEKDLKYIVYEKLIVSPDDTSVLSYNKTDSRLTLITCHPYVLATHRLIIHAKLAAK